MKWVISAGLLLALTAELNAGPHLGFGAEGGFLRAYRNDRISESGYLSPGYLKSLGGHLRVPLQKFELAFIGMFEWRTLLTQDTQGPVNLSIDQVSVTASIRRSLTHGKLAWFLGAGPSGYRLRRHFSPPDGRAPPSIDYQVGFQIEAGVFLESPWRRADAGLGIRHSLIKDPRVSGTLLWVGFTVWPQSP